jgi:hypothetical protein
MKKIEFFPGTRANINSAKETLAKRSVIAVGSALGAAGLTAYAYVASHGGPNAYDTALAAQAVRVYQDHRANLSGLDPVTVGPHATPKAIGHFVNEGLIAAGNSDALTQVEQDCVAASASGAHLDPETTRDLKAAIVRNSDEGYRQLLDLQTAYVGCKGALDRHGRRYEDRIPTGYYPPDYSPGPVVSLTPPGDHHLVGMSPSPS